MRAPSGKDIRNDFNSLMNSVSAISEKFLKAEDPSMVFADYFNKIDSKVSKLKALYRETAQDRNEMKGRAANILKEIEIITKEAMSKVGLSQSDVSEPEDKNSSTEE